MTTPVAPETALPPPRRRSMRRSFVLCGAGLSLLVLLAGTGIRLSGVAENWGFYVPSSRPFETPAGFEDVSFTTSDGLTLNAWCLPPVGRGPNDPPAPAVLFCHGNAGCLPDHLSFARFLTQRGLCVFMFDYRSYGRSQHGHLSRENLAKDVEAAYAALKKRPEVDPSRIGVYGFSLGGTFALNLSAAHPEIKAACTVAGFSSWGSIAGDHVPLLGNLLIPTGIDGDHAAALLGKRPYLIVHGDADHIVPPRHAEVLEQAARRGGADVTRLVITGGDHNRILSKHPEALAGISDFFAKNLGGTPAPTP